MRNKNVIFVLFLLLFVGLAGYVYYGYRTHELTPKQALAKFDGYYSSDARLQNLDIESSIALRRDDIYVVTLNAKDVYSTYSLYCYISATDGNPFLLTTPELIEQFVEFMPAITFFEGKIYQDNLKEHIVVEQQDEDVAVSLLDSNTDYAHLIYKISKISGCMHPNTPGYF